MTAARTWVVVVGARLLARATSPDIPPGAGWREAVGDEATRPLDVVDVPDEIPLRQLLFGLRDTGWITHAEALAAARTGAMPATMAAILAGAVAAGVLTAAQAEDAELTWAAMYTANRTDALWDLFVATGTATREQIADVFRVGSAR